MFLKSLLARVWAIVGSIVAISALVKAIDWITQKIQDYPLLLIEKASEEGLPIAAGVYTYNYYAVFFGLSASVFLAIFIVLFFLDKINIGKKNQKDLTNEIDFLIHNHRKIIYQLYHDEPFPRINFNSIDYTCHVDADGNGTITHKLSVQAAEETAHYWKYRISADEGTYAANSINDISLKVDSPKQETDVALLMIDNKPYFKQFAIFFLPEIKPGEEREITISYHWPKFMEKLTKEGRAYYSWEFKTQSLESETDLRLLLQFDKSLGYVNCKNQGMAINDQDLSSNMIEDSVLCWEYKNPAARLGNKKIEFLFSKTEY